MDENTGNAGTPPNDNGHADNRTAEERIEALASKNTELLGKLTSEKDARKGLETKMTQLFEHLELDASDGDPFQKLQERKREDAQKKVDSMSNSEKQEHRINELTATVGELLEKNKQESEKALKLELDNSVNGALSASGVNSKGLAILGNFVKTGLQHDDKGYFAIENGARLSVADYTQTIALQYPMFIEASSKAGSGTNDPTRQTPTTRIQDSVKDNNPRATIKQLVAQEMNRG